MSQHCLGRRRRRGYAPVSSSGKDARVIFSVNSSDDESYVELTGTEEEILYERPNSSGLLFDTFELLADFQETLIKPHSSSFQADEETERFRPLPEYIQPVHEADTDDNASVTCFPQLRVSDNFGRFISSAKLRIRTATRSNRQRRARASAAGEQVTSLNTLDVISKEKRG